MNECRGAEIYCPTCGDQLIHCSLRGAHESSSLLGQYIHDQFGRTFSWMDIDGLFWKRSDQRLLIIEHKYPGQTLKSSQREILPRLGRIVGHAVDGGLIREGEVVDLVGAPPWEHCTVTSWPFKERRDCSIADLLREQPIAAPSRTARLTAPIPTGGQS